MQNSIKRGLVFLFVSFCFSYVQALKVLPVMAFRYNPTSRDAFLSTMMPLLAKKGIVFVDKDPDLVMICGRAKREVCINCRTAEIYDYV